MAGHAALSGIDKNRWEQLLLLMFLVRERRLHSASRWAPYIALLPELHSFTHLVLWDEEALNRLPSRLATPCRSLRQKDRREVSVLVWQGQVYAECYLVKTH